MHKEIGMRLYWKTNQGKRMLILFASAVLLLCLFEIQPVRADDALNVKRESEKTVYTVGASDEKNNALDVQRDKEKTVYSIGPNKTKRDEETKDKERSWDMLKNMGIVIDEGQDKHHRNKNQQGQTNQSQQSQPSPAK
jgi:hypothetical protein